MRTQAAVAVDAAAVLQALVEVFLHVRAVGFSHRTLYVFQLPAELCHQPLRILPVTALDVHMILSAATILH
jgi:hypothetical protein